jgi:Tol biopolymer transport system component
MSDESGTGQLFVRSFPNAEDFRVQVSVDAGRAPVWSEDGTTLFYREGLGAASRITAVTVTTGSAFSLQARRDLFPVSPYFVTSAASGYDYHDGDGTFIMIRQDESAGQGDLILIQNFHSDPTLFGSD